MKSITLYRQYSPEYTAGVIPFEDQMIYTVERPWICEDEEEHRAGKPFYSCIPEGTYQLDPFTRGNGREVWSLSNPDLGVFVKESDRLYDTDRYACLIHSANFVHQINGCVAPGLGADMASGYMVSNSRAAMSALRRLLSDITHLEITSYETIAAKAQN